jgi:hypothetical protein
MARRKTTRRSRTPKKLFAKIKKDGVFKGTGDWAGSQIGGELGKITKKAVPAFMLLTAISAVTPPLGASIANSVRSIPVVAPLANVSASYGSQLRSRFMR